MLHLLIASIPYRTAFLLIVILGILLIVEILVYAIMLVRKRNGLTVPVVEQQIVSIPLVYMQDSAKNKMRYNKSFTARLIQSNDDVKQWYITLKNELLSYKKIKARTSWKRETFRVGRKVVARISFRGKTICLYLPLNTADFAESKYRVEDVSAVLLNVETPLLYRLKNARRIKYATELIAMSMEKLGIVRTERVAEDYYAPYEGTLELINKGLIKRVKY